MLDRLFIPLSQKILDPFGAKLFEAKMTPEILYLAGLAFGLAAAMMAGFSLYMMGFFLFVLSRLLDGLAEASGRAGGITAFGRYLDLALQFIVFGAIYMGFGLSSDTNALIAGLVLFTFVVWGGTNIAFAGVSKGLGKKKDPAGNRLIDFLADIAGSTEVTLLTMGMFLVPDFFAAFAILLAALLLCAGAFRVVKARLVFWE